MPEGIALDLGATNFRARLGGKGLSRTGHIVLPNLGSAEQELQVLTDWLGRFIEGSSLASCVLALAPNMLKGRVSSWPNRPHWKNLSLKTSLEAVVNCQVEIVSDGGAAAVADASSLNVTDLISIVIGTGIGAGIVANGDLLAGASGRSGEVGHVMIGLSDGPICVCGRNGCLQAYFRSPVREELLNNDVLQALNRTLVNLSEIFDPHVICLSGGWSAALSRSWSAIEAGCANLMREGQSMPVLIRSQHTYDAPLAGAYILAMRSLEQKIGKK